MDLIDESAELLNQLQFYFDTNPVTDENLEKILKQIWKNNSKLYEFFMGLYRNICAIEHNIDFTVLVLIDKIRKFLSSLRKSGQIQDKDDESVISDSYGFDICPEIVVWQKIEKQKKIELTGIIGCLLDFFEHYSLNGSQRIESVKKIYAETCICNCPECGGKKIYQKESEFFV